MDEFLCLVTPNEVAVADMGHAYTYVLNQRHHIGWCSSLRGSLVAMLCAGHLEAYLSFGVGKALQQRGEDACDYFCLGIGALASRLTALGRRECKNIGRPLH